MNGINKNLKNNDYYEKSDREVENDADREDNCSAKEDLANRSSLDSKEGPKEFLK